MFNVLTLQVIIICSCYWQTPRSSQHS